MIPLFLYIYVTICTDPLFLVPKDDENVDLYISLKDVLTQEMYSTFLVTELLDEDIVDGVVSTYDKRSENGRKTKPYFFKPISSEEKQSVKKTLSDYRVIQCKETNLVDLFYSGNVILKTTFVLDAKKAYFIDVFNITKEPICFFYSTSEKIRFDRLNRLYEIIWLGFYSPPTIEKNVSVPSLYRDNLFILNQFINLKDDLEIINRDLQSKIVFEQKEKNFDDYDCMLSITNDNEINCPIATDNFTEIKNFVKDNSARNRDLKHCNGIKYTENNNNKILNTIDISTDKDLNFFERNSRSVNSNAKEPVKVVMPDIAFSPERVENINFSGEKNFTNEDKKDVKEKEKNNDKNKDEKNKLENEKSHVKQFLLGFFFFKVVLIVYYKLLRSNKKIF
ncbi:putative SP-containing membrane protein [Vairimorpha necatrix]|uniref:SP-containing membrane protein n=1 Tax=Vairimorpha necatrix TaxID=6039 RepID=A0AAX4JEX0_9MICR